MVARSSEYRLIDAEKCTSVNTPAVNLCLKWMVCILEQRQHRLFICGDYGDEPWDFPEPDWWRWKETEGYRSYHNHLPRNLIDDAKVTDWPGALQYLHATKSAWAPYEPLTDEGVEFKRGFERAVAEYCGQK